MNPRKSNAPYSDAIQHPLCDLGLHAFRKVERHWERTKPFYECRCGATREIEAVVTFGGDFSGPEFNHPMATSTCRFGHKMKVPARTLFSMPLTCHICFEGAFFRNKEIGEQ